MNVVPLRALATRGSSFSKPSQARACFSTTLTMAGNARTSSESIARLAGRIPKDTWDTHMHVVDPRSFPLSADAQYQPQPHTLTDAHSFLSRLGIEKMVIVQPSIYGNDNSCTLDGLKGLGLKNGRAVIQFDPDTSSREQLQQWHDAGVRGVRLNFKSVGGKVEEDALAKQMQKYADAIRDFGWVLELYIAVNDIPILEKVASGIPDVKICVDHLGHPSPAALKDATTAHDLPGFQSLLNLLQQGRTWCKVSATYRLDKDPKHPLIQSLIKETVKARPDRCVFASDWPHTRFDGLDVGPYLETVLDGIESQGVPLKQVLVDNAEELFDAK